MSISGAVVITCKIFFKRHPFCTISQLFPLLNGFGPFPLPYGCFVSSLVKFGPVVLDKNSKILKSLQKLQVTYMIKGGWRTVIKREILYKYSFS